MLDPVMAAAARLRGRDAARAVAVGGRPQPCPYDADAGSLTLARLAHQWSLGFADEHGEPRPLPEG